MRMYCMLQMLWCWCLVSTDIGYLSGQCWSWDTHWSPLDSATVTTVLSWPHSTQLTALQHSNLHFAHHHYFLIYILLTIDRHLLKVGFHEGHWNELIRHKMLFSLRFDLDFPSSNLSWLLPKTKNIIIVNHSLAVGLVIAMLQYAVMDST